MTILIVRGGVLEDTLTDIQNFNFTPEFEIKSVGYLGEKTNRKDEIYNGVKFDLEMHLHKQSWFTMLAAMKARATRESPDLQFNISGIFSFPNGETPSILFSDVKWGETPHNIGSRGDYVKVKLQGECSDFDVTQS